MEEEDGPAIIVDGTLSWTFTATNQAMEIPLSGIADVFLSSIDLQAVTPPPPLNGKKRGAARGGVEEPVTERYFALTVRGHRQVTPSLVQFGFRRRGEAEQLKSLLQSGLVKT